MNNVIKVIGIVFVFLAIINLLKPAVFKSIMAFFKKGKRIYLAGVLRFVFAVIFLVGANQCRRPLIIIALGILFIISGMLVFTLGLEKLKAMIEWYQKKPDFFLRAMSVIILAIGAVIIYAA